MFSVPSMSLDVCPVVLLPNPPVGLLVEAARCRGSPPSQPFSRVGRVACRVSGDLVVSLSAYQDLYLSL